MASLMKATQPHWLGNKFVPAGNVLPAGHSEALPEFYEAYEIEEAPELDGQAPAAPGEKRAVPVPEEPPRGGPGSGRDAWVAYAGARGVEVTEDMSREDIMAAVES